MMTYKILSLANFVRSNGRIYILFSLNLPYLFRKKLSMQIVPYMPIHPTQLKTNNTTEDEKKKELSENDKTSSVTTNRIQTKIDDHIFKVPPVPTPYTVEEPLCDSTSKRSSTMKR